MAVLGASLGFASSALAQPVPQGADLSRQADEHFMKAKALLQAGDRRGAYDEYKAAWELKRTYDTATNLATLELALGMPRDAAEHLAFAVRNYAVTGVTADKLDRMKQAFAEARAQVGAATITVNVPGAEVFVDGRSVGRSPLKDEVFLDPGARVIEARRDGFDVASVTVQAAKGSGESVTLTLHATGGPNKVALIVGGSAAGLGIVLGAVFAGVSASKASSASDQRAAILKSGSSSCAAGAAAAPACAQLADTADAKRTFANASVWSFVAGGAVGVATLVYALAAPKGAPSAPEVRVAPAGARGAILTLRGTW